MLIIIIVSTSLLFLCACEADNKNYPYDIYLNNPQDEWRTDQDKKPLPTKTAIPPKDDHILPKLPASFYQPVSLSMSDAVSLKDIFLSLAQQTQATLLLSPDIKGGAVVHAHKRPLLEIIQELCENHGLRYRMTRQLMKIEIDRPYLKTYHLEFLILARTNQNRFSIATDVFTGPESQSGADENSSNTLLTAESKTDFWQELAENLDIILSVGNTTGEENHPPSRYTIHKQAGLISVFATQQQHQQINEYIKILRQSIERQVLIEAKILEVNLRDEFKSGINWNIIKDSLVLQAPLGNLAMPGPFEKHTHPHKDVFTIGGGDHELTGLLSLLNRFGTVRTLSNPRITVINNQPAVLKVATNKVYFKLNYTRDYNYFDKREQVYVSSDAKTVPIGLVMVVQPSIRHEDGKIIMTLRPTISRIIQEVPDPAVGIASNQKQISCVPEVQVRELDSVLAMTSGETVVVGGLMEDRCDNENSRVPEISDIPLLGSLFNSQSSDHHVTELVIFLRATIINNDGHTPETQRSSISPADETVYGTFTQDPRPLKFYEDH